MQWFKNKILVYSIIYFFYLVFVFVAFGMWYNQILANSLQGNWQVAFPFIISVVLSSFLYLSLVRSAASTIQIEKEDKASIVSEVNELEDVYEDKSFEEFNKEQFIAAIIPGESTALVEYCEGLLKNLATQLEIVQGIFYLKAKEENTYDAVASYAYYKNQTPPGFVIGESLNGQALKDKRILIVQNIPEDYISVVSGLGKSNPKCIVMLPIVYNNAPVGLIEFASFKALDSVYESAFKELSGVIGENITKLTK